MHPTALLPASQHLFSWEIELVPHLTPHLSSLSEKDRNCPIPNWGRQGWDSVVELMFWHQEGERTEEGRKTQVEKWEAWRLLDLFPNARRQAQCRASLPRGRQASQRTTSHGMLSGNTGLPALGIYCATCLHPGCPWVPHSPPTICGHLPGLPCNVVVDASVLGAFSSKATFPESSILLIS